jgi:hypothetical protein
VQLGVERLLADPALRLGERVRPGLLAVDRHVPLLVERGRRRLRHRRGERRVERAPDAAHRLDRLAPLGLRIPAGAAGRGVRSGPRVAASGVAATARGRAAFVDRLGSAGRRLLAARHDLGIGVGRHALAHRDHVPAVLAADLEDLAANPVIADRIPGVAAVAEKLHAVLRPPGQRKQPARSKRIARRSTSRHCAEKTWTWQRSADDTGRISA